MLLPGGSQVLLGQNGRGAAYAAGTIGLAGWGGWAQTVKSRGELNAPFVFAQQVYVLSIYEGWRDMRLGSGLRSRTDPASLGELASAPFRRESLSSPWVIGSAAAGAGLNLLEASLRRDRRSSRGMSRVSYLGASFNPAWGTAAYSAYWVPLSLGAGVAEESLFRGMLQGEFEGMWGDRGGLAAASGLFGLAHLTRLNSAQSWGQAGFAALAGTYLGWRYQENGRRLRESVASHFWFDLAAGLAVFACDPGNNPLGARIEWAF
jgi:membrane protease YdiL (CAAX protease family)